MAIKPQRALKLARAKNLFMLNVPGKEIAQKVGVPYATIRQWSARHGWSHERLDIRVENRALAHAIPTSEAVEIAQMNTEQGQHLERVAKVYIAQIDHLANIIPTSPRESTEIANALKTLDDVARRSLGLENSPVESGRKTTFNFNLGAVRVEKLTASGQAGSAQLPDIDAGNVQVVDSEMDD